MQRSYKEMNGHQANGGVEQEVQPGDVQAGWGKPFPSLHLWPLQDTFQMKMIHLPEGQRIKIGRQTNPKTQPGERNAYFDSKVLSRLHAEIWEHDGKIYIKDVKSSNGTFINNERLSPESVESDPYPLKHEDIVEFGIDIVGDDNRSILHHKVAAKVYCVFNISDAALSARELANYSDHRNPRRQHSGQSNGGPGPRAAPQSSLGPLVLSSGGKVNGLSFDQIYSRLHHEMQMSKELGGSLQTLSDSMTDIQDNLGGGLPPSQNGSAAEFIPIQYRETSAEAKAALASPHGQQAAAVINLQNQLTQTQNSLTGHLDKIRQLEDQFKDHETLKHEVTAMREQMEGSQREMKMLLSSKRGRQMFGRGQLNGDDDYDDDQNAASDDDDTRSVVTLMDNEDAQERVRTRHRSEKETRSKSSERSASPSGSTNGDRSHHDKEVNGDVVKENAELVAKIEIMSNEIAEVVQLSKNLQTQHGEAMNAVKVLTQRVTELEGGIADRISAEVNKVENKWEIWKTKCEDGWRRDRESWDVERERLRGVVREWEEASRRAYEEEEDRELNERLSSEDDYEDDDDDEEDEGEGEEDEGEGHDRGSKAVKSGEGILNGEWATVLDSNNPISPMGLKTGSPSGSLRKSASTKRGRRPSHRTLLAIRGIQAVADPEASGNSTPKAEAQAITSEDAVPDASPKGIASRLKSKELSKSGKARRRNRENTIYGSKDGREIKRNGSQETFKQEKDSSESGKESGDTLKESDKIATASGRKMKKLPEQQQGLRQPIPIFTVFIVAAVAGAIYYKHKE